jgi:serine/threonine-protein kinase
VSTILEGSVRRSGNRLRITAQLIDTIEGYHLWSERYDKEIEMRDIFDVQDEITVAVVDALKVSLLGEEKAAVLKRHTENTEAYHLYLKGRFYWFKPMPEDFRKSCEFFQRAVEADPFYALGYSGLAYFYGFASSWGMMLPTQGWPKMEAAILKAQELDDTSAEVHNGLAALKWVCYRDWAGAERELKRALELNPNFAEAHNLYGIYLAALGRFDDAIAECRRALEVDPLSLRFSRFLGNWFYYLRQYDKAIKQYSQALELDPNNALMHEDLGDAFGHAGLHSEAVAAWRRGMILVGDKELAAIVDSAYTEEGFSGAVRSVALKRLERLAAKCERGEYVPSIYFARAYVSLDDKEQAFQWLDKANEERNVFPLMIKGDPFYDSLRADQRFNDLLRRVGLAQ